MSAAAALPYRPEATIPPAPGPGRLSVAVALSSAALLGAAIGIGSPLLVVAALVPLLLTTISRPGGAVLLFSAGLYLNLPVIVAQNTGLPQSVTSLYALLLLIPFVAVIVLGRQPLVITPALALMIGYLVALVLSATIAANGDPTTVGPISTFLTEGLLLYVLVSNVVRTPALLRAVLWTIVLAGAAMGAASVWQQVTGSFGNDLGGFAKVSDAVFDVGTDATGQKLQPRLAGPIGEKNRYAQVLLVLIPLAVALVMTERRRSLKALAALSAALALSGMALTFSRGAAVALVAGALLMPVVGLIRWRHLLSFAVLAAIVLTIVAPEYVGRVQTLGQADTSLSQGAQTDGAIEGRATENLAALYVFRDYPLLGVGPEQFFREYSAKYGNALNLRFLETNRRAHNLYLEIAADTGTVGLASFLGIVGVTIAGLWRAIRTWRRRDPEVAMYARGLLMAIVFYMASAVFLQLSYERYFWLLIALANATIWMLRRAARDVALSATS